MSSMTLVEKYPQNKKSNMAIRPYFDRAVDNMGLQNYGLSLYDGAMHEEQLACLEINGIKKYLTGLDEYSLDIKELPEEEREAKIKNIRQVVAQLEKDLAANIVDPKDPEFWNKVKLLKPDNSEFWDKIKIRCSNDPVFLEPDKDPYDLIKYYAIEARGFSIVAKSLEEARKQAVPPKFYLDKLEETANTRTEVKKLRNKAVAELEKMFNSNQNKLFYMAKTLDPASTQYNKSTPYDIIYDNMDKYINGELLEKDKRKTAQRFLDTADLDMETLKMKAVIKDAAIYKMIGTKSDGFIYHIKSSSMMGRNQTEAVEFVKNPLNEDVLTDLLDGVERYWNQ